MKSIGKTSMSQLQAKAKSAKFAKIEPKQEPADDEDVQLL